MKSATLFPKVLVVDDEPMVRRMVSAVLTHSGYRVISAEGPAQAMALLEEDSSVNLMLTDVMMPGGDGRELARRMRERRPSLRVLFMSGYGNSGDATIAKPFRIEELLRQVEGSLA